MPVAYGGSLRSEDDGSEDALEMATGYDATGYDEEQGPPSWAVRAHNGGPGGRRTGKCKWFNVVKGFGFVTPDDGGQDVFVHQTVIQMTGFRSLGEGEGVEFESRPSDKGIEATYVCGLGGLDCRGSERRPISRKKFRKIRCYNCGDFANHIAAKCPHGPLPKRCHFCKAENHLIADCPSRRHGDTNNSSNGDNSDYGPDNGSPPPPAPSPPPPVSTWPDGAKSSVVGSSSADTGHVS